MNKKGFTLVELIAIVAILAMITALAVPNITKEVTANETQQNKVKNETIENAAKVYASKYYADRLVMKNNNCNIEFDFDDMEKDGIISTKDLECSASSKIGINFVDDGGILKARYHINASCYSADSHDNFIKGYTGFTYSVSGCGS